MLSYKTILGAFFVSLFVLYSTDGHTKNSPLTVTCHYQKEGLGDVRGTVVLNEMGDSEKIGTLANGKDVFVEIMAIASSKRQIFLRIGDRNEQDGKTREWSGFEDNFRIIYTQYNGPDIDENVGCYFDPR